MAELTKNERKQIAEILSRRANEIAGFKGDYQKSDNHYGSVELALSRDIANAKIEALQRSADNESISV